MIDYIPSIVSILEMAVLVIASWIFMVGAMRKSVTTIAHHAVHRTFSKNPYVNLAIAEVATTISLSAPFSEYEQGHKKQHHVATVFTTEEDPDAAFLLELGFLPGTPKHALWRHLIATFFSPEFHARYAWSRIRQNFLTAKPYRIVMSCVWWAIIAYVMVSGYALITTLVYLVPITILFQISALSQFISEHEWLAEKRPNEPAVLAHSHHSWGRFIGPDLPDQTQSLASRLIAWAVFYIRLVVVHIPVRVSILPGDLPQHDQHHRKPMGDWSNAAYERHDSATLDDLKVPYKHFWSLHAAIDHVFESLSRLDARPNQQLEKL